MSTELTVPGAAGTVSLIQQTALELTAAHQIASAIAGTSFVPQHFRGKPDECAVAILYGATIDFDPVTAIQQIYVIGGKPALYARAMVAVVLSKGHDIWVEEEAPGKVTVAGRRKGSDRVQKITWTTEDARRAGYTSNKKYDTDPRAMLYARASGDIARRIAPDALMGMAYTVEELELGITPESAAARSERSGVSRLRAAVPPKDEVDEAFETPAADADEATSTEAVVMMTAYQNRQMHALFRDLGIDDETVQRAGISKSLGREVESKKSLTQAEAAFIIDALKARKSQQETTPVPADDVEWPEVAEPGSEVA
ncbi:hypothetical protein [Cellulomonas rhizosphaerae]|uniref:Recombinase RecT n=1 Tax=Cellulomonas rhizosphaerae TaxID=2293719 RepID=A0A413RJI1_9CELL|nr:hypothetical protein [Cellulomonas rhizosphaerae]RHA38688.1 hypothetical protein D1825_13215 [Cellulomonas rhizosphaerae]